MTSTTTAPADSIFAVMSPQSGDRSTTPPVIPHLGMMIDRTSFDETDDFGVNQAAMNNSESYVAGPPVIMKDGKVRRRLRWRPKGMAKRRRAPPVINKPHSSNSSVVSTSNFSQISKQSRKSLHSFASTETASINNTTKKNKKFPLPRPSPKHLDGGGVATIGNEGDFVHARIQGNTAACSPPTTLFAAADLGEEVRPQPTSSPKAKTSKSKAAAGSEGKSIPPKGRSVVAEAKPLTNVEFAVGSWKGDATSSPRRNGLPPLFQRPACKVSESPVSTPSTSAGSVSPSDSIESSLDDDTTDGDRSLVPIPVLSGDEVETERRLDFRIRGTPSTMSFLQSDSATLDDGDDPLMAQELRFDEERQDLNPCGTMGSILASSMSSSSTSASRISPSLLHSVVVGDSSIIANFRRSRKAKPVVSHTLSSTSSLSCAELPVSMSNTSAFSTPSVASRSSWPSPLRTKKSTSFSSEHTATTTTTTPTHKAHTGPVDVDNGTFLEAEKNLQAIHEMASEHLKQGECAEALEVFEEILRGQLARYGEDHHRVGTALHNIGIVHMRRGDYVCALEVYKEAVRVRKNSLDPFHPDVAASLAQLGVAYMERNKHRKAIGAFREALKIRRKSLGNEHPKVAKILNNIGCSLFELDELEVAKVAFEEALDIQRNLLRHPPSASAPVSESSLLSIASTQSNIASIKLYCGQFDEAIVDLEEALLIQQCALGDDHPVARRTQESLLWMERSRKTASAPASVDLLTQLTGTMSTKESKDPSLSMFDSLYSRFDFACGGWDGNDEDDASSNDNDSEISSRE